ncbi:hypothetical protein M8494_13700 [Serratia ureilytica]
MQVNAGLFFHGAKPTHYKDRDGQMKPIDGGTLAAHHRAASGGAAARQVKAPSEPVALLRGRTRPLIAP